MVEATEKKIIYTDEGSTIRAMSGEKLENKEKVAEKEDWRKRSEVQVGLMVKF